MEQEPVLFPKPTHILFDVYETLLDMEPIERRVNDLLNNKRGYSYWFELLMQYCFVENSLQTFTCFPAIAGATLKMAGKTLGVSVADAQADEIVDLFYHLPLNEGINDSLSQLADRDLQLAALTNAPRDVIINRMERTGLISYFELVMSAEEVRRYKPDKEVYRWAATRLGVPPENILFVSSHSWDIAGAAAMGCQTAYVEQAKQLYYPLAPAPTISLRNLGQLISFLWQTIALQEDGGISDR